MNRICIICDADTPQVNGVVRHLHDTISFLEKSGKKVLLISPKIFKKKACISQKDKVEWVFPGEYKKFSEILENFSPQSIHIMTEGSLGLMGKKICKKNGWKYTSSYHTKWPEYFEKRYFIPKRISYFFLEKFHAQSEKIFTPSEFIAREIEKNGISAQKKVIANAVDLKKFFPSEKKKNQALFVGRIAKEKNIEAFLELKTPNLEKIVVGDGPEREKLEKKYPEATFLGEKKGEALRKIFAESKIFVFPSLTDTFGIVLLESLACNTPIAAFPMPQTEKILTLTKGGSINKNLSNAIKNAQKQEINRSALEKNFSLENVGKIFLENLVPIQ